MAYPLNPEKIQEASATNPSSLYEEDEEIPDTVILCFQPPLYEYAKDAYQGYHLDPEHPRYRLYVLSRTDGTVGIAGGLGIGGPASARVIEELIARGVTSIVILGHAGGLQRDIKLGDVVVATQALRDEGTSYHYLEPTRTVTASESLSTTLTTAFEATGEIVHVGKTWTIDAMFRQTVPEVEQHAAEGVLTVDMESACAFAVATYRDIRAGAAFIVSDYIGPENWDVHPTDTWPHLERVLDTTIDALKSET